MLVHSLASKYARFVVIVRQMYWTPPFRPLDPPPLLKSDDLFFREPRDIGPPPFQKSWTRPWTNTSCSCRRSKGTSGCLDGSVLESMHPPGLY